MNEIDRLRYLKLALRVFAAVFASACIRSLFSGRQVGPGIQDSPSISK